MSDQETRVPHLDLVLDHARDQVTRGTRQTVDFAGHPRRWAVLTELAKRADAYCSVETLVREVWDKSDPAGSEIELTTVYSTISMVRRALHPLGITIVNKSGLGYQLREIG
jgi:DNA-binding response OmpR family regulator